MVGIDSVELLYTDAGGLNVSPSHVSMGKGIDLFVGNG